MVKLVKRRTLSTITEWRHAGNLAPQIASCFADLTIEEEKMAGFDSYLAEHLWPGLMFWGLLYISDYYLTLICARLYHRGARNKLALEGSYEITPYFQPDIDSLRTVSPRFIAAFLWTEAWLGATWWFSLQSTAALYEIVFGAMVSVELAVHIRHLRNLFLFRAIVCSDQVQGRIQYARPLSLRISAVELYGFTALFFLLFVFTQSWFTLGGTLSCFVTASKHLRLAQKATSAKLTETRPSVVTES